MARHPKPRAMFDTLPSNVKCIIYEFLETADIFSCYEQVEETEKAELCDYECNNKTPMCTDACRLFYSAQLSETPRSDASEDPSVDSADTCMWE